MEKLYEIGIRMGLEGKELRTFVTEQQRIEDREQELEMRKLEIELRS